jgi:hypothetical protein
MAGKPLTLGLLAVDAVTWLYAVVLPAKLLG